MTVPMQFSPAGNSDQRRDKDRNELRLLAEVSLQQGPRGDIRIENISTYGLLLNTPLDLAPGETVTVFLPNMEERIAEVVWSSDNFHGCRFADPLDKAMLEAIKQRNEAFRSSISGSPLSEDGNDGVKGESFGDRLTRLRKAEDLKQNQLAEAVGVSKTTVWKWENDVVRPRNSALKKLSHILDVSEIEMLFGAKAAQPAQDNNATSETADLQQTVAKCKRMIAAAACTSSENVRISIEV